MPFDVIGFGEATPGTTTIPLAGGLGDTLYRVNGDDIYCKSQAPYLLGVIASSVSTGGRILVRQPSLPIDYEIIKNTLMASPDPAGQYTDMLARPLPLVPNEKINVLTVNATDEDALVGLLLGSGKITKQMQDAVNPTHRLMGYADTTVTAYTWSALTMTWNQDLPEGRYAPIGMRVGVFKSSIAQTGLARLRFKEVPSASWGPGVPTAETGAAHLEFQDITKVNCYDWPLMPQVSFRHDQLPDVEILGAEAFTDEDVELLLQKVG